MLLPLSAPTVDVFVVCLAVEVVDLNVVVIVAAVAVVVNVVSVLHGGQVGGSGLAVCSAQIGHGVACGHGGSAC